MRGKVAETGEMGGREEDLVGKGEGQLGGGFIRSGDLCNHASETPPPPLPTPPPPPTCYFFPTLVLLKQLWTEDTQQGTTRFLCPVTGRLVTNRGSWHQSLFLDWLVESRQAFPRAPPRTPRHIRGLVAAAAAPATSRLIQIRIPRFPFIRICMVYT
ncbi:hypothetical protein E2C01_070049 [Portunus trituberculatus]|uniref:Uncharacterized protein n=1 Tax=Portunus trituberculatus TaxID=210409 RepID=A0A5B7I133_PORTR|nr:hypothetical protein [Portunus trituberculatus]